MNYYKITFLFFLTFPFGSIAQEEGNKLEVSWELLENSLDEPAWHRALFEITNKTETDLEAGWKLYFKSSFLSVEVQSDNPNFHVRHLTGDLFLVEGRPISPALLSQQSLRISYHSPEPFFKNSHAPQGLILEKSDGTYFEVENYQVRKMSLGDFEEYVKDTALTSRSEIPPFVHMPKDWKYNGVADTVRNAGLVVLGDNIFSNESKFLTIKILQGYKPEIDRSEKPVQIRISNREEIPSEGYRLEIRDRRVLILASDTNGAFYGVQAFLALMPADFWDGAGSHLILPQLEIEDFPRIDKEEKEIP